MKKSHILFVINPKSGGTDKLGLDKLIGKQCKKREQSYALHYTEGNNDLQLIKDAIEEKQPTTVVACGGDGTINLVAQALINSEVSLGIIPLGSANGLAYEFDIPEDEEDSLMIILNKKAKPLDVVRINDDKISLHLSDVGFNAKMIQEFEKDESRGKLGYAKAFFKSILNRESETYSIETDTGKFSVKAEMLVFANASSYGTGAIINPESELDDGKFEIIVFKPIPFTDLAGLTFESFFGDIADSPFVEIHQITKATVKCEKPQLLQVDGELIGEVEDIKLEILAGAIQLIRP